MRYFTFFTFIKNNFGVNTVRCMKQWINLQKCVTRQKLLINFLKKCLRFDIIPPHMNRFAQYENNLHHFKEKIKFGHIMNKFISNMIRNEISDAYSQIRRACSLNMAHIRHISEILPNDILNTFFSKQNRSLSFHLESQRRRFEKKFEWLLAKREKLMENRTRPVQYYCSLPPRPSNGGSRQMIANNNDGSQSTIRNAKFSFNPPLQHPPTTTFKVCLDPRNFRQPVPSVLEIRNKWFMNLTSAHIPLEVQGLLQLGENFCLPPKSRDKVITDFLKSFEHSIDRLPSTSRTAVRSRAFPIIKKLPDHSFDTATTNKTLFRAAHTTSKFMAENTNIIFTKADKGNVTVALDREDYLNKMRTLLSDNDTYTVVKKDPTRKIINGLHDILTRWKRMNYINYATYRRLNCSDGVLPRAYGLPKIHKPNCPLRIIVSSVNSPLHSIATFLHNIIHGSIPKAHSHIDNSFELVDKLTGLHIEDNYKLISLDVVSLFTNIPVELAMESILNRWEHIEMNCSIPRDEFLCAVRFVLNSTFFSFNNVNYQQAFGTPMGSPLSPIIADITLQDLEKRVLGTLSFELPFYFRYVDDIALSVPSSMLEFTLN